MLSGFIQRTMRMSHIYQPVMLMELLNRGGSASRREIAAALQTASIEALDALKRNVACGLPAIEVRAASALLDQSLRATELAGLEARLDALEDTVKAERTHE